MLDQPTTRSAYLWRAAYTLVIAAWALLKRRSARGLVHKIGEMTRAAERNVREALIALAASMILPARARMPETNTREQKAREANTLRPRTFSVLPPKPTAAEYTYTYRPTLLIDLSEERTREQLRRLQARLKALAPVLNNPAQYILRLARLLAAGQRTGRQRHGYAPAEQMPDHAFIARRGQNPPPAIDSS